MTTRYKQLCIACDERDILFEVKGRTLEWWKRGRDDDIHVCSTLTEALEEIRAEPVVPTVLQFDGQLEIDTARGVIYFHDNATGRTVLRICRLDPEGLKRIKLAGTSAIDITTGHGVSYGR